jgi:ribosomal protein L28
MSRSCDLCGKKATRANHVSHAKNKVPRRQKPNLQLLTLDGQKIKVCSGCRRTQSKKNA